MDHRSILRNLQALHAAKRSSAPRPPDVRALTPRDAAGATEELRQALADSRFLPVPQAHVQAVLRQVTAVHELRVPDAAQLSVSVFCAPEPLLAAVDMQGLQRVLDRVLTLFDTCDALSRSRAAGLRILIFPLPAPRTYPTAASTELVGPAHLNGGFYMPGQRLIVITRHEEYPKVLLHEVLHHLMGVTGNNDHHHHHALNAAFGVAPETKLLLDEAITETLAVVCHCAFLSAERSPSDGGPAARTAALKAMLGHELRWCTAIVQRLARMYGWPARPWRERTNAFCYLFLRCALMQDLDAFARLWRTPAEVASWLLERGRGRALPLSKAASNVQGVSAESLRMTRYGNET